MDRTTLSEDDTGKRVINFKGKKVGMISDYRNGTAYVDPDPGITDSIRSKLGWGDKGDDDYRLESRRVEKITDDAVHLKR